MVVESVRQGDIEFSTLHENALNAEYPGTVYTEEDVKALKSKKEYQDVLSEDGIKDLILNANPNTLETVIRWSWNAVNEEEAPIKLFSSVAGRMFDTLPEEQKADFLSNASKLALLNFKQTYKVPKRAGGYSTFSLLRIKKDYRNRPHVDNIRVLFKKALEFTNGDIDKAHDILGKNISRSDKSDSDLVNLALLALTTPRNQNADMEFIDPKVSALAFLMNADLGDFNPKSGKFTFLQEKVFPISSQEVQIQILRFMQRELKNRSVGSAPTGVLEHFYLNWSKRNSALSEELVGEMDRLRDRLDISKLFRKMRESGGAGKEVRELLGAKRRLIDMMDIEELEEMRRLSKDNGVSEYFDKLIMEKENVREK